METKTTLLSAAQDFVRTRGFDAFSFADLSKHAGIRKASVHYHFPTKADLALELVTTYSSDFKASLEQLDGSAADRLNAYLDIYQAALKGGTALCLCVSFGAARSSFDAPVQKQLCEFRRDSLNWLEAVFKLGATDGSIMAVSKPADEAAACFALVQGAQLMARSAEDISHFTSAVAALRSRLT